VDRGGHGSLEVCEGSPFRLILLSRLV
jgi:hypothetical protein